MTLVDRANHHVFQPLLYQVATAGLSAPHIAAPIRCILRRQRNCRVLLGEATRIDVAARRVTLADGTTLDYDYLVVATGVTHSYFGHDDWARVRARPQDARRRARRSAGASSSRSSAPRARPTGRARAHG